MRINWEHEIIVNKIVVGEVECELEVSCEFDAEYSGWLIDIEAIYIGGEKVVKDASSFIIALEHEIAVEADDVFRTPHDPRTIRTIEKWVALWA